MLRMRCPVCLHGKVFHSFFRMNKACPECGIVFEREDGYYLNSMFIAYGLGFLIVVPSAVLLAMRQVSIAFFSIFMVVEVIIIWPIVWRYSRVLWLHLDQVLDPRPVPSDSVTTDETESPL
jgi:uncharacterized protein (DUF983 family)